MEVDVGQAESALSDARRREVTLAMGGPSSVRGECDRRGRIYLNLIQGLPGKRQGIHFSPSPKFDQDRCITRRPHQSV